MIAEAIKQPDRPWWWWLLLPIILPLALFFGVLIMLSMAVILPIAMVKERRLRRREDLKLRSDGRVCTLHDAILSLGADDRLVAELGKNDIARVWMVRLTPHEWDFLRVLPTVEEFEQNKRAACERLDAVDNETFGSVIPALRNAVRVEASLAEVKSLPIDIRRSTKVIGWWQDASPSGLLRNSIMSPQDA
jgi:hypothetical protein